MCKFLCKQHCLGIFSPNTRRPKGRVASVFLQGYLQSAERCSENTCQCALQQVGLEPLKRPLQSSWGEAVPAEVWVCIARLPVSQMCVWGSTSMWLSACLCVCVFILYMCCPSSHSSSDSTSNSMRKIVAGKSNKRDLEDNRSVWKLCLLSVLDKNISTDILYLLSVELYYWEIWPSQSVSWIAYSCFLFWALLCTSVSQSALGAVCPVL